jgi:hypothetical protein
MAKRFHVQTLHGKTWWNYRPAWAKRDDYLWLQAQAIRVQLTRKLGKHSVRVRLVTHPSTPTYPNATHWTPRYTRAETRSKDGVPVPHSLEPNIIRICQAMERISDRMGRKVYGLSWYRSPAENYRVNGATSSQHMSATAVDPILLPGERTKMLAAAKADPAIKGIGIYPAGGLHFDVRAGGRVYWDDWVGHR